MTTSSSGLTGSVTHACRMWVVIGSGTPAMSHSSVLQPAVQLMTWPGADRAAVGAHRVDAAVAALEAEDLGVGVDLGPARVGAAGQAPDDGVVADDAAGRVVERAQDRIGRVLADVHRRGQALDLVGPDQARVDALQAVDLGAVGHHEHRAVGVREREVAALREEQVEVQLLRQALVELDARVVEARALGRLVVRAQDRRVAPGRARADVALLEDRDVGDPALAQVVGGGQAVRAAADDDDVVGALERRGAGATCAAGGRCHARAASRSRASTPTGPPPRLLGRVGDDGPQVLAERPAEEHQEALGVLAQDIARGAGHRAGAEAADRHRPAGAGPARRSARSTSRASGPTMASAASVVVDARARRALARGAEHQRALARDRAPPGAVRPRRGAAAASAWRAGMTSSLRRCETSAQPTGGRRARRRRGSRRRRSSRRARSHPRAGGAAPGAPSGCGRRRRPTARRNSRTRAHERSTSPSGS